MLAYTPRDSNHFRMPASAYWDSIAPHYDRLYQSSWSKHEDEYVKQSLAWLGDLQSPRVLDLGCGTGLGYEFCKETNPGLRYVGVDISAGMLAQFRRTHPGVELICADIRDLSASELGQFDVIVSFFISLSYVDSLYPVLQNLSGLIKPGGYVRLSVLNAYSLRRMAKLKTGSFELYGTRGVSLANLAPVRTYTHKELTVMTDQLGWRVVQQDSFSAFAGLAEHAWLWPLDRTICRVAPPLAHTTDLLVRTT